MSEQFEILEPAIDPNNRITFLLDWELTMKCNLDCTYCTTGLYGGHDNSTKHPPLDECLKTIYFMFKYVDTYMLHKPKGIRYVILNVYGGESLHHPNILHILQKIHEVYQSKYQKSWHLTVTTTTNAIISEKKLEKIIPYINEFTVSYHTENTVKQQAQFKKNLLLIKKYEKRLKCVVMMHATEHLFNDAHLFGQWCLENQIQYLPKQLDYSSSSTHLNYSKNQIFWLENLYQKKQFNSDRKVQIKEVEGKFNLADSGRACCGGRQVCLNGNHKQREFFVENKFPDWYCSVNEFFLYVKQVTGELFTNKDCKMNFEGQVAPIGNLDDTEKLLDWTEKNLKEKTMPVIQCKKYKCLCGLCAPKAKNKEDFNRIMEKYRK